MRTFLAYAKELAILIGYGIAIVAITLIITLVFLSDPIL